MSADNWTRLLRATMLPLFVGLVAAIAAQLFVALVVALNDWLLISADARTAAEPGWLLAATVLVPTAGGLAVGLIRSLARGPSEQGPAEIIAAVQTRAGRPAGPGSRASTSTSLVSLGTGAAVGEYGPLVHMGGHLGGALARLLRTNITAANIAMAGGVAASIATVFNAPIAGILFAHEVILRHFAPRAFAPVALASITGYIVGNAFSTRQPLLAAGRIAPPELWEFGLFALLGVAGAGLAMVFMYAILGAGRAARRIRRFEPLKPAAAGLVLGLAALSLPEILGMGFELLQSVTSGTPMPIGVLAVILAARLLATALCLGFGFTGGVFAPAMVIGSLFGAVVGIVLDQWAGLPVSGSAVYAICGMMAVTAPVIGAPVTAVVIVMELTGSYTLTLAALASVAIANFAVSRLFGRSFFDRQLGQQGLDLSAGRNKAIFASRTITPLVSGQYVALGLEIATGEARRAMVDARLSQAFIVDDRGIYRGTIRLKDILRGAPDRPAIELRNRDDVVMLDDSSIWRAMHRLKRFDAESVAVVDNHGRLAGALYASDLISTYLDIQADLRAEEQIRTG